MRDDDDFFCQSLDQLPSDKIAVKYNRKEIKSAGDQWVGKTNFVEIRSFWHIFRSFDRMWIFFILCLQAMIIIAWNGSGQLSSIFDADVFRKVLSVFITVAILNLGQAVLDIILTWKARRSMPFAVKLRYILKVVAAAVWVIILPLTYTFSLEKPTWFAQTKKNWFGNGPQSTSLYILAVVIFLAPNMLAVLLFLFPFVQQFLEKSDYKIVMLVMWWSQPRFYVGRRMHESAFSLFMYTMFWLLIIITKIAVSYYVEVKPLVGPTKSLMPACRNNIGVLVALWAPIILVYFMDTQIWFAIFSTLFGVICGLYHRVGEIRNLGMLRARFRSLPDSFNACLISMEKSEPSEKKILPNEEIKRAKFSQLWNQIIKCFREEDLISNRERDLLLVPYWADRDLQVMQWPPFLLAGKIPIALDMAKDSNGKDRGLKERLNADIYMFCAICECYGSFRNIINYLVQGADEENVINEIFTEVDKHIATDTLLSGLRLSALPSLCGKFVELIVYLQKNKPEDRDQVVILFQDMLEVVTRDIMEHRIPLAKRNLQESGMAALRNHFTQLFASPGAIRFPIESETEAWIEKINRLHILLTMEKSARDVPTNIEVRRRLLFFSNSSFMNMPSAPKVYNMLSFSVLTPYYVEEVRVSRKDLQAQNEDGVSILFGLQKMYPDEWANFVERIGMEGQNPCLEEELCLWASYRRPTLTRTVRGMMYYRRALELQAFLDMAKDDDMLEGCMAVNHEEHSEIVDMKFTYVVSCQKYGIDKRSVNARALDIRRLMTRYPSLRVAFVDEVEKCSMEEGKMIYPKVYYSTLVKAAPKPLNPSEPAELLDQVIYRIKLPGPPILGEEKAEDQNNAIIFTRGEGLQTTNMSQDNYMEEAFKMRNLLEEFRNKQDCVRNPSILGLRKHIFSGSVSSLTSFMSNLETNFVTIMHRMLANPLKVRFHCDHSDIFDRLFHLTIGGVSKASNFINLSENIFAGCNSVLREGNITYHEYMQVGKGRDVDFNQISQFEAKIAIGNGEQTLSRDIYRLGHCSDFFRMLSCYFTTVGFHFSSLLTVLAVYVFLYGRIYPVLGGLEEDLITQTAIHNVKPLQVVIGSQSLVQLGFLMVLPMMMEISLEKGFSIALTEFIMMLVQMAPVFFTFSLGTKAHHYGRTLLHGGADYRATDNKLMVFRAKFTENYRLYSRSHFVKGIELMILLFVYQLVGITYRYRGSASNALISILMWFMVVSWLLAPFLFNPFGFEWQKIVDDWAEWNRWMNKRGDIGLTPEKSWESWWETQQEDLRHSGILGIIAEIVLACRFFIFQYGLVYHLNITKGTKSVLVYGASWLVVIGILIVMKCVSYVRRKIGANFQLVTRLFEGLIFIISISTLAILIALHYLTVPDIFVCILAFVPTGWGLLLIAQACKPAVRCIGFWGTFRTLARGYDIVMGFFLFVPIAFLAWFPFVSGFLAWFPLVSGFLVWFPLVSEIQRRKLLNNTVGESIDITGILSEQRKDIAYRKEE